jgi:hypothetical protein
MECPVCGLINPPLTPRCDCGYDFDKHAGGRRQRPFGFHSVVPSLWFAWLLVTAADFATLNDSGYADLWNYFPNALFNLFTPILFGNLSAKGVPVLIFGLLLGDLVGKRIRFKSLRLVYNLLVLFALTTAIDEINWGSPKSIQNIKEAYNCVSTRPRPPWCAVAAQP